MSDVIKTDLELDIQDSDISDQTYVIKVCNEPRETLAMKYTVVLKALFSSFTVLCLLSLDI